jgi:hypothetical protein
MRTGIALWNHAGESDAEKAALFADAGFRAASSLGARFVAMNDDAGDRLAEVVRARGLAFTVHHRLPYGDKPPLPAEFPGHIERILRWQRRHGLLTGLTFDVDAAMFDAWAPHLRATLEAFRGEETFVACEDFPLDAAALAKLGGMEKAFPHLAILIDLGHMNLRLTKALGRTPSAEEVEKYLRAIPFPIRELHVHNNDGLRDQHQHLGAGTLPFAAAGRTLAAMGFDAISTIEFVPSWNDVPADKGRELAVASARTWEQALLL